MELKIEKLSDIVAWADGKIRDGGYYEEKYKSDATTAYCNVKAYELWKIRDVVLKGIGRHSVYTNALNKDIVDKDAKIDLLEKEIEGRKAGYAALKELMDTKYISIDEHNKICKRHEDKVAKLEKESEKWQDLAKMNRDTICDQYGVCEEFKKKITELEEKVKHQRENLDGINKTLEMRTKENERLIAVKNNQAREIEAHESENTRLSENVKYWKEAFETQSTSLAEVRKLNDGLVDTLNKSSDKVEELEKQVKNLTTELEKTYKEKEIDLKNHNKRDMTLVDELGKKNDLIKNLGQQIEALKTSLEYEKNIKENWHENARELVETCRHKNDEIDNLKKEIKNKNEMIRKAYVRYVDEACKSREEIMNDCYKILTKDDTGYIGFKQYTLGALEAQEGNEETAEEFLCDAIEIIFHNWWAEKKRKEETKKELNEAFDIPCGEDAIE